MVTTNVGERPCAAECYDACYAGDYLRDYWSTVKQRIVAEVVRSLHLPPCGIALDFGCGRGDMTDLLRRTLPGWEVHGMDPSEVALRWAKEHHPECCFRSVADMGAMKARFDLVFSHHVLEHVADFGASLGEIAACLKPTAWMLHILPCGNPGSFEHSLCLLRRDGVDPASGRFFFDDPSHVRRLTTEELVSFCARVGFRLVAEYYRNQNWGAIEWITASGPDFVAHLTEPHMAMGESARRQLQRIRSRLLCIARLRSLAHEAERLWAKPAKRGGDMLRLVKIVPAYPLGKGVALYWQRQARWEWRTRRHERNGSEMFLCFARP